MYTAISDDVLDHLPLTKIIATIGPASSDQQMVSKLIDAGVSLFRLNFSHGSLEQHARAVTAIRAAAAEADEPTAIIGDLQGPKIRVGPLPESGCMIPTGSVVHVQREAGPCGDASPFRLSSTCDTIIDEVKPGQRLLINDGAVRMLVVKADQQRVTCTVTHGGLVTTGKGINLPDSDLSVRSMTEQDWRCAQWAVEHDLDFLALSFVRSEMDVRELLTGLENIKAKLDLQDMRMPVIAKIELPQAVKNIDAIVDIADGIMVARGDLGVEMDLARVPVIQKRLLQIADNHGKPCIVATQMLESMIHSPTPTRAEASDVAGAIVDAADAVMLSGETAVGSYPAVAVEHMRRIAHYTEKYLGSLTQTASAPQKLIESRYRTAALAHGVWTVAQDVGARFIMVWSQQGGGARYLSQNNFRIPIFAATSDERAARRMQLLRGVRPIVMPVPPSSAGFAAATDAYMLKHGEAQVGDMYVLVAGEPIGREGVTNSLTIHRLAPPDKQEGSASR